MIMNKELDQKVQSDTAPNTLVKKSRDRNLISGGHLVARTLRNEGVDTDTIFTLCGCQCPG